MNLLLIPLPHIIKKDFKRVVLWWWKLKNNHHNRMQYLVSSFRWVLLITIFTNKERKHWLAQYSHPKKLDVLVFSPRTLSFTPQGPPSYRPKCEDQISSSFQHWSSSCVRWKCDDWTREAMAAVSIKIHSAFENIRILSEIKMVHCTFPLQTSSTNIVLSEQRLIFRQMADFYTTTL